MINIKKIYTLFLKFSNREKTILYAAVAFVLVMIVDRLILNPVLFKLQFLDAEIELKSAQIQADLHVLAQEARIAEATKRYAKYSIKDLSVGEITTLLLKEIGDLTNKASVYLINIKPAGIKGEDLYKKYYVDLSCEAKMDQIIEFMHSIESSNSLLKIEKYNINPKEEDRTISRCTMMISKTAIP